MLINGVLIASLDVISNPGRNSSTMAILPWRPKAPEDLVKEHRPFPVVRAIVTWCRSWPGGTKPHSDRELRAQCQDVREKGKLEIPAWKERDWWEEMQRSCREAWLVTVVLPPLPENLFPFHYIFWCSCCWCFLEARCTALMAEAQSGTMIAHLQWELKGVLLPTLLAVMEREVDEGAAPAPREGRHIGRQIAWGLRSWTVPVDARQRWPGWTLLTLQSDPVAWPSSQHFSTSGCRSLHLHGYFCPWPCSSVRAYCKQTKNRGGAARAWESASVSQGFLEGRFLLKIQVDQKCRCYCYGTWAENLVKEDKHFS